MKERRPVMMSNVLVTTIEVGIPIPEDGRVKKFFDLDSLPAPKPKPYTRQNRITRKMKVEAIRDGFVLSSKFYPLIRLSRVTLPLKRAELRTGFRFEARRWWVIVQFDKEEDETLLRMIELPRHAKILGTGAGGKRDLIDLKQRLREYRLEDPERGYEIVEGVRIWRIK